MSLRWRLVAPPRFYAIAAAVAPDAPVNHLLLARYCAAMGLAEEARDELREASSAPALADEIRSVRALVE